MNAHHPQLVLATNLIYITFVKQFNKFENKLKDVDTKVEENIQQTRINTREIEISRRMEKARVSIKDAQTEDKFKTSWSIPFRGFNKRGYITTFELSTE